MRKLPVLLAVPAVAAALAIPALAATKSVKVGDNWFVTKKGVPTVTARVGDTVRWRFIWKAPHNVTVTRGPVRFRSATKSSGSYAQKLKKAGTYRIICTIHGAKDQSMVLKVRK
jgi:plastocyanin